jgi:hypothetical protein
MKRHYYSDSIANFLSASTNEILGTLAENSGFDIQLTQRNAWLEEINILKETLPNSQGMIYFEYSIPRMGKRIDTVLLIGPALFVLEFKIGEKEFTSYALNQAYDYALDLKNFHETSRELFIAPIVIATKASAPMPAIVTTVHNDKVLAPIRCTVDLLAQTCDGYWSVPTVVQLMPADGKVVGILPHLPSLKRQWPSTIVTQSRRFRETMPQRLISA